jgi:hypothetical protein
MNMVIMSARSWIGGKPTIEKIIKENDSESVITVAKKDGQEIFILGSGNAPYGEDGSFHTYKLDTGNGYRGGGRIEIQNSIIIDNEKVLDGGNEIGLHEKRTLYVFK